MLLYTILMSAGCVDVPTTGNHITFVVVGDTGKDPAIQQSVAAGMASVCSAEGCDFALLLGDNFYNCGVDPDTGSGPDPLWDSFFNNVYTASSLDIPFYAIPGNHDYWGKDGNGDCDNSQDFALERAGAQVSYTLSHYPDDTNFNMPWLPSYTMTESHDWIELFPLDTQRIVLGMGDDGSTGTSLQWSDTADRIASSTASFKIAFGHHPYLSNGSHGNAGSYDNTPFPGICDPTTHIPVPYASKKAGTCLKEYMETNVCGKVDLYLSGHDHNLQYIEPVAACGDTAFVVSGSGSQVSSLSGTNATYHEAAEAGFFLIKVCGPLGRLDELTMYKHDGTALYTYTHPDAALCPITITEKEELQIRTAAGAGTFPDTTDTTPEDTEPGDTGPDDTGKDEVPILEEGFETSLTEQRGCIDTTMIANQPDDTIAMILEVPELLARASEAGKIEETHDLSAETAALSVDLGEKVHISRCASPKEGTTIRNTYEATAGKLVVTLEVGDSGEDTVGRFSLYDVTFKDGAEHTMTVPSFDSKEITILTDWER